MEFKPSNPCTLNGNDDDDNEATGLSELILFIASLVRPHLDYGAQAWRPHFIKDKDLLEK